MSKITELAMEFKKRNNVKVIGNILGTVLSVNPLKIGILNNEVILDDTNCFLCNNLVENHKRNATMEIKEYTVAATASDTSGDSITSISVPSKNDYDVIIKFKDILKINDRVLIIADDSGQIFFILDKVVI